MPLRTNTSIPADRLHSSPFVRTDPVPETPTKITSTSSLMCSPTPPPASKRTRLAFRSLLSCNVQITPVRSPAAAAIPARSISHPLDPVCASWTTPPCTSVQSGRHSQPPRSRATPSIIYHRNSMYFGGGSQDEREWRNQGKDG